jgi:imidazole glycerol phosphate synthase subunit HisF
VTRQLIARAVADAVPVPVIASGGGSYATGWERRPPSQKPVLNNARLAAIANGYG